MKVNPEKKELVPYHQDQSLAREGRFTYGQQWGETAKLVTKFNRALEASAPMSPAENGNMVRAVGHVLRTAVLEDRRGWIHQDLEEIVEEAKRDRWTDAEVQRHLLAVQTAYGLSAEEIAYEAHQRQLAKARLGITSLPLPCFKPDRENPARRQVRLAALANLGIQEKDEETIEVVMKPLYDGGIDSVSYPLYALRLQVAPGRPIESDFDRSIFFKRRHDINQELTHHPEVAAKLKGQFAHILDRYTTDREGFLRERSWCGAQDSTQLHDFLFEYLKEEYLKEKLDEVAYEHFKSALEYLLGGGVASVVHLRTMSENLLNSDAHIRKADSYYSKKYPRQLANVVEIARAELARLGCEFSGDEIANLPDVIQRAITDEEYATALNDVWERVLSPSRETVYYLIRRELQTHASIHYDDLYKGIFQTALEWARGLITQTPGERKNVSIFFRPRKPAPPSPQEENSKE